MGGQDRIGADSSYEVTDGLSLQPSVQAATGGFVGGSLNAQVGHAWYGLLGFGRTNLKPYCNLNFDPNDAITLGGGHQFDNGQNWSLFVIHDDRLHTGQTDWHLMARIPIEADSLSLDLMRKSGDGDVGYIKAWALSVTWDFPSWFVRLVRDPNRIFLPMTHGVFQVACAFESELKAHDAHQPFQQLTRGRWPLPIGMAAFRNEALRPIGQPVDLFGTVESRGQLVVEKQAAAVEIGGAAQRELLVNDHGLRMQHAGVKHHLCA